jgi:putative CocE/NonD family hydrolase
MSAIVWVLASILARAPTGPSSCHAAIAGEASPPMARMSVPASYQLSRVRIPMRDGVCLDTFILAPKTTVQRYPILLVRTPYDPTAEWMSPEPEFSSAGYIFAIQSVRGRYGSDGHFVEMRPQNDHKSSATDIDESTDAFDTIDWLVKNVRNNNQRVGLRGISYNGFYAAIGMIDAHPALKAVSPQAPQADWFLGDDTHHNGAFLLASTFNFLIDCDRLSSGLRTCEQNFRSPSTDGYRFFLSLEPLSNIDRGYFHGDSPEWRVMMQHGTYDALWRQRAILGHLRDIEPAVLVVSGWYDANNLYGALHVFEGVRRNSPSTPDRLVVGPWTHAQWAHDPGTSAGPLSFGSPTASYFIRNIELPFFESYLKGNGRPDIPVATVFDTGLDNWTSFDAWPPTQSIKASLYFGPHGSLGLEAPKAPPRAGGVLGASLAAGSGDDSYDQYVSDPANPVPFVADHGMDMDADYMTHDQRFTMGRSDVLSYESEALTTDLTIAGPVSPRVVVSTSGSDSDWVVKLIDVHPTGSSAADAMSGFQELVRGDVMRAKFRESFSTPTPMTPNEPTHIDFTMTDVYHTFRKGHRILVQVQSSWFPLVDLNPQRFEDIYEAKPADFQRASQRLYHTAEYLSRVELNVLPPVQRLPQQSN